MLTYSSTVNNEQYIPSIASLETSEAFKEVYKSIINGESSSRNITRKYKDGIPERYKYTWKKVNTYISVKWI